MKEKIKDIFLIIFEWGVIVLIGYGIISAFGDNGNNYQPYGYSNNYYFYYDYSDNYYNEIDGESEKPNGSYTVEACNTRTGKCYDLDADISDGVVETIYFPNGGHLDLDGAELDENGYAVGESYTHSEGYDGDEWEINCCDCY